MTVTSVGLPQSPVVDGNRNITPEWLQAVGRIDRLNTLKQQQAAVNALDLDPVEAAVKAAEDALASIIANTHANTVVFTKLDSVEVPDPSVAGVKHRLGTDDYIAMYIKPDDTIFPVGAGLITGGSMATKDAIIWTGDQTNSAAFFFTFTAFV